VRKNIKLSINVRLNNQMRQCVSEICISEVRKYVKTSKKVRKQGHSRVRK
jgi:hypothetical protein